MSSFAALKDDRHARQRPLVSKYIAPFTQHEVREPESSVESEAGGGHTGFVVAELGVKMYRLPKTLVVRTSASRGRGIHVASVKFNKGSTVLSVEPAIQVLSTSHLASYCSHCFLSPHELAIASSSARKKLLRCKACGVARYCSSTCQKAAWSTHQPECKALSKIKAMYLKTYPDRMTNVKDGKDDTWVPNETIRSLGRACWRRRKDAEWWKPIGQMESHRTHLSHAEAERIGKQALFLQHYLSAESTPLADDTLQAAEMSTYGFKDAAEVVDLCSAFQVNSFTLSSPSLTAIGMSTSPTVALCNHSCEPNAVVVFPFGGGKGMQVIALRDLEPGEELLTAYIDISVPRHIRQADLKERYHFTCDCTLCSAEGVDPRWAVKHEGCSQNGIATLPVTISGKTVCQCSAGITIGSKLKKAIESGFTLLQEDESSTLDTISALPRLAIVLSTLLPALPPSSHPLLALLRLASLLLSRPDSSKPAALAYSNRQQAIQFSSQAHLGSLQAYPNGHPTRGVILAELGKLINAETWASESGAQIMVPSEGLPQMRLARETMTKALEELRVGFGHKGGLVGVEMEGLVEGLVREMAALGSAT